MTTLTQLSRKSYQTPQSVTRVPLWIVAFAAGIAALALVALFSYGAYTGLGSAL